METALASLACSASIAWCVERLVRAGDSRWALVPLSLAIAAWCWLWTVRTPTAGRALLAFSIADLGILVIGVVGVVRLLGGFDRQAWFEDGDDDDDDDDPAPILPPGPDPTLRHPLARHHVPPRNRRRQDHRRRRPTEV